MRRSSETSMKEEEIGRGALGVVHRGEDTTDGRSVAMRLIPKALLGEPGLLPALAADLKAAFSPGCWALPR